MQIAYFELANNKTFTEENVVINYFTQYDGLVHEGQCEIGVVTELNVDDEIIVRAGGNIIGGGKTSVTDRMGQLLILDDKYAVPITKIQWFEFV